MKNVLSFFVFSLFLVPFFVETNSCNKKSANSISLWDSLNLGVDSISFLVMGDWGKMGGQSQKPVADAMDEVSRKFHAQFIITTGDNFYPAGVSSITDVHWKSSFEDVYNKEGHQIPWYPVLGNHDYQSNPQAEVQYSTVSDRWKCRQGIIR
jgi:predicted MPP superfamily phosphohydrolase